MDPVNQGPGLPIISSDDEENQPLPPTFLSRVTSCFHGCQELLRYWDCLDGALSPRVQCLYASGVGMMMGGFVVNVLSFISDGPFSSTAFRSGFLGVATLGLGLVITGSCISFREEAERDPDEEEQSLIPEDF